MTWLNPLPVAHECGPPTTIPEGCRAGALWRCSCNGLWVLDQDGPGMWWRGAGWRLRWRYRRWIWRNGIAPPVVTDAPWDKPPADFDG